LQTNEPRTAWPLEGLGRDYDAISICPRLAIGTVCRSARSRGDKRSLLQFPRLCAILAQALGHPFLRRKVATAGYDPATLVTAVDGYGLHDLWLFEGLLPTENGDLHVTASHYDDPIATKLVENTRRCISLHGCTDTQANGRIQLGGLDHELRDIVLEELEAVGIPAEITINPMLDGSLPDNIANKTKIGGCAQLEMGTNYRRSLFGINTRPQRKNTTNAQFWLLVGALRKSMSRV
jgi:phage replication-related protein YjqB (UPF0714/DUF867 family)